MVKLVSWQTSLNVLWNHTDINRTTSGNYFLPPPSYYCDHHLRTLPLRTKCFPDDNWKWLKVLSEKKRSSLIVGKTRENVNKIWRVYTDNQKRSTSSITQNWPTNILAMAVGGGVSRLKREELELLMKWKLGGYDRVIVLTVNPFVRHPL